MKAVTAKKAEDGFGRLIDLARTQSVDAHKAGSNCGGDDGS